MWSVFTRYALFAFLITKALADGNPCPLYSNDTAMRSCGPSLCFAGQFKNFADLQQSPQRSALYGSSGNPPLINANVFVTLFGTLDSGLYYNKTFETVTMSDGTWKTVLDAMPTFGEFTASATMNDQTVKITNLTFGDV